MRLKVLGLAAGCLLGCDGDGSVSAAQMRSQDVLDMADLDQALPDQALTDQGVDQNAPDQALDQAVDQALDQAVDQLVDAAPLPEPRPITEQGPFNVGYRVIEVTHTPPLTGMPRTLRTALWYPTRAETGDPVLYGNIYRRHEALGNAPPVAIDGPVMVFSHGNWGFAEQSFGLTEFFASHGWLVAAPDHTGNTFSNREIRLDHLFELRPQDIHAVIDALEALPADDPLGGRVANGVLLSGHSFGGYTTLAVSGAGYAIDEMRAECRANPAAPAAECDYLDAAAPRFETGFGDPRVVAGIPLTPAGANVFRQGTADVDIPLLFVTAGRDVTLPNAVEGDPLWSPMDGPDAVRLDFPNAGHFSFTSFCGRLGNFAANDGCSDEFISPDRVMQITQEYALAFARYHLLQAPEYADLLTGAQTPYTEEMTVSTSP